MIPKNWRIRIFNWLGAGKLTLTTDKSTDYVPSTYYSINPNGAGGGGAGNLYYGSLGGGNGHSFNYNPQSDLSKMNITASSINFNVAKAAGGWIVQVNKINRDVVSIGGAMTDQDLHIIHESEDFDSALGKIVTMSCLKA